MCTKAPGGGGLWAVDLALHLWCLKLAAKFTTENPGASVHFPTHSPHLFWWWRGGGQIRLPLSVRTYWCACSGPGHLGISGGLIDEVPLVHVMQQRSALVLWGPQTLCPSPELLGMAWLVAQGAHSTSGTRGIMPGPAVHRSCTLLCNFAAFWPYVTIPTSDVVESTLQLLRSGNN